MIQSDASCSFYRIWNTITGVLVASLFAVVSLDRLLSLTMPQRMPQVTCRQAWICMGFTFAFAVGLSFTWFVDVGIVLDVRLGRYKCWRKHDSAIWNLASVFVYHGRLVFLLLSTILNAAMTLKIFKIVRDRRKLQEGQKSTVKLSHVFICTGSGMAGSIQLFGQYLQSDLHLLNPLG